MGKKAVSGIMLILFTISMLSLATNIQSVKAEPKTWIIDDDGPADFHTIQEAIKAASPGDIIFVKTGTFYESDCKQERLNHRRIKGNYSH